MELKLTYEDKKRLHSFFFESEDGKLFRQLLEDMRSEALETAESVYLKLQCPNEQIAANVGRASGIKSVIDFINSTDAEVKEHKKGGQEQSESNSLIATVKPAYQKFFTNIRN